VTDGKLATPCEATDPTQWTSMASYRFIFDNDSRKTAEFFPRRRIVSLEQAGLTEKAGDREIVEVASDRKWIIVTANGDHFIAEIKRYLRQSMKLVCHDLSGLVIVPKDYQLQQRAPRMGKRKSLDSSDASTARREAWLDTAAPASNSTKNGGVQTRTPPEI